MSMIASVICIEVANDTIQEIDRKIKLCLSNLDMIEKGVTMLHCEIITQTEEPCWPSNYIFQSLL